MQELSFEKGKEYFFPQTRKGNSEVGMCIKRTALTSALGKKKVVKSSTRRGVERVD